MKKLFFNLSIAVLIIVTLSLSTYSQTTSISYQGNLEDEGSPANGNYNFAFRLYDSGTFGNQLGNELSRTNITVTDGIFTITNLDFGANFTGTTIWLEIDVRKGIIGDYTTLTPRQRVNSSPSAIQSLKSVDSDRLGGIPPNLYVRTNDPNFVRTDDPRLTNSRTPTSGSSFYIQNRTSVQPSSNFRISGLGRANQLAATSNLSVGSTSFSNPLVAVGTGTDVGGVNNQDYVIARFRNLQSNRDSAISIDSASDRDSILYFAHGGDASWEIRSDVSSDSLHFVKQSGLQALSFFSLHESPVQEKYRWLKVDAELRYPGIAQPILGPFPGLCIENIQSFKVGYCPPSSIRYKKNIVDYSSGIELVRNLRPVTFNYKKSEIADFGLIAEEVAEIEPYLVLFDENKRINGVRYDRIGVVLINAINEQQDEIEMLRETIEKQKTETDSLKKQRFEFEELKAFVCRERKNAEFCKGVS